MEMNWSDSLAEQLDWQWQNHLRPRLNGLTDHEYFWEPVPGCWSVRQRSGSTAPRQVGTGDWVFEFAYPEPDPPPVTTIAWRLAHMIVGVLGERNASHFGGPPVNFEEFAYAGSAAGALEQLDDAYAIWNKAVRALGPDGLARPCGPAEGPYAEYPLAQLVLHINREALHHGAELALMRDLYRAKGTNHDAL